MRSMFRGIGSPFAHVLREIAPGNVPIEFVGSGSTTEATGGSKLTGVFGQIGLGREDVTRLVPHPVNSNAPAIRKLLRVVSTTGRFEV